VVEIGDADAVLDAPMHPYTQALLRAAPGMEPGRRSDKAALAGELPSPLAIPSGCSFHPRCPLAFDRCRVEVPRPHVQANGHRADCHLARHSAEGELMEARSGD
jgi:oligopeptide/dipeptide ABC transporter ATP-binding protein